MDFSQRFQIPETATAQQISKAENQVLGVLQAKAEAEALSIREIATALGKRSAQAVYAALKKLLDKGLVSQVQAVSEVREAA